MEQYYEVKSQFELKDIDGQTGVVTGYASIFNVKDSDNDIIIPGAFSKSIAERGPGGANRIKHLWQHDPMSVIGVPTVMKEDDRGLYFESRFGSDTFSQDKLKMHKDGLITELSIGFNVIKHSYADDVAEVRVRKLHELKLWEYSSVTWGANSLTHVVSAKGTEAWDQLDSVNERMNRLSKALRKGNYTDESCYQFEMELKQLQQLYNDLIRQLKDATPTAEQAQEPATETIDERKNELNEFINLLNL